MHKIIWALFHSSLRQNSQAPKRDIILPLGNMVLGTTWMKLYPPSLWQEEEEEEVILLLLINGLQQPLLGVPLKDLNRRLWNSFQQIVLKI